MRKLFFLMIAFLLYKNVKAQKSIKDESVVYQQERMVHKQWDRSKFTPTSGWLGINPYYWMTWGLHPNYPKTDHRPLSPTGPQTQRLGLVAGMSSIDDAYKLHADTLSNSAVLEIANQSGAVSFADPLWILYYSKELKPVLENSMASILMPLPTKVRVKVVEEGIYDWYKNQLDMLQERIETARTSTLDRGARILAYHRMLKEYRALYGTWSTRIAAAQMTMRMTEQQQKVKTNNVTIDTWTPEMDVKIARDVINTRKY
ncbi:hypothetical protein FA048_12725 [Pedobacter polaris]|uniref:DUF5045 domain-containing protein n=1 Tax=Pedobacter polaris TaxID=2571273 RepID=A0A4U1CQZ4_9SPHI|nr:hypothetical protein [Pedobacter polaris]TKC08021.1 hypothetical protein FA048_12725 [Pedobacter polaris]